VFAGPRYANVDQSLNVTYAGGDVLTDRVHRCTCFDGGGVRAGGETHWKVLDHLGLYLRGSASLLTGRFHSCKFEEANGFTVVDVAERYTRVVPMVDMGVGLSFEKGNWRLSAGYEFMTWYNMVDASDFIDDAHPAKLIRSVGNLGFDGVVFRAEMSFQRRPLLPGGDVPQDRQPRVPGRQRLAVGRERQAAHLAELAGQLAHLLAGRRRPQPHRTVAAARREQAAARLERQRLHVARVALQRPQRVAGVHVPQPHAPVEAAGRDHLAVRRQGQRPHPVALTEDEPLAAGVERAAPRVRQIPHPHPRPR
jgi:hypothetical protein